MNYFQRRVKLIVIFPNTDKSKEKKGDIKPNISRHVETVCQLTARGDVFPITGMVDMFPSTYVSNFIATTHVEAPTLLVRDAKRIEVAAEAGLMQNPPTRNSNRWKRAMSII